MGERRDGGHASVLVLCCEIQGVFLLSAFHVEYLAFHALGEKTDFHLPWLKAIPEGAVVSVLEHFNVTEVRHVAALVQVGDPHSFLIAQLHPTHVNAMRNDNNRVTREYTHFDSREWENLRTLDVLGA